VFITINYYLRIWDRFLDYYIYSCNNL